MLSGSTSEERLAWELQDGQAFQQSRDLAATVLVLFGPSVRVQGTEMYSLFFLVVLCQCKGDCTIVPTSLF